MMAVLKMRQRGQITVPIEMRHVLGMHDNSNLLAYVEGQSLILKPLPPSSDDLDDLVGLLPSKGDVDVGQARADARTERANRRSEAFMALDETAATRME